ncbi:MAG: hypothetical protein ACI9JM_003144 [Halioglobus sp.]|jgi:hypothetical protein
MPVSLPEQLNNWRFHHLKSLHFVVPLLLAVLMLVALQYLKNNPLQVKNALNCSNDDTTCLLLGDVVRDLSSLEYDLKRQQFDKQQLPILHIYLTDGSLEKLYLKRQITLDKPGRILLGEDDDWVKASLIADEGGKAEKLKGRLRLKGDWGDHIDHPTKLSFRIKVKKEGYVFGMKRFSIQHPKTRNSQGELLMLDEMRRWGILAPRYRLVDVRINDYRIGVMALEEHISKELLESQQRREGPVVVVDEDPMWRQRDLNARMAHQYSDGKAPTMHHAHFRLNDLPVKQFGAPDYLPGTTATNNSTRALSLYRDYLDGVVPAKQVFNLPQLARWWVLVNTWYGCHGVADHNRRFYFNPTTNLLEPIAFDNTPIPSERGEQAENCDTLVAPYVLSNPAFQGYVLDFSEQLLASYQSTQWQLQFQQAQVDALNILALDTEVETSTLFVKDFLSNLSQFLDTIKFRKVKRVVKEDIRDFVRYFPDAPLQFHVRAFLIPTQVGMTLEIKNLTGEPLRNIRVTLSEGDGTPIAVEGPAVVPEFQGATAAEKPVHIVFIDIDRQFTKGTNVTVAFQFRDKSFVELAVPQFRNHDTGYDADFAAALAGRTGVELDTEAKTITFGRATHVFEHSVEIDQGWSVTAVAGAKLSFLSGATLKIRGPLYFRGTETDPVVVNISPALGYRDVGAWGGILVVGSAGRSHIQHAVLSGAGEQTLANRQDYYGITGCISFYESDVNISDTKFVDMHCEDALNIVRSEFTLDNSIIQGARADGFDSDFSLGRVMNSHFIATGNDAIDVSGTQLSVEKVRFSNIGDKAISVGEESVLHASQLEINGSSTGVASKDLSNATVSDSRFNNISGSALLTYIKKTEYGGAFIDCRNCVFENTGSIASNQNGSQIIIDGALQAITNFNQVQLTEAGFVTE